MLRVRSPSPAPNFKKLTLLVPQFAHSPLVRPPQIVGKLWGIFSPLAYQLPPETPLLDVIHHWWRACNAPSSESTSDQESPRSERRRLRDQRAAWRRCCEDHGNENPRSWL